MFVLAPSLEARELLGPGWMRLESADEGVVPHPVDLTLLVVSSSRVGVVPTNVPQLIFHQQRVSQCPRLGSRELLDKQRDPLLQPAPGPFAHHYPQH